MTLEKESLIQQADTVKKHNSSIPLKYFTVIPAVIFLFVGSSINKYVVNEWTQYVIRTDDFANTTSVHNFSACSDTNHSDPSYKQYKIVQQKTAEWLAIYNTVHDVPMLIGSIILVSYTDTYGRRFSFVLTSLFLLTRIALVAVIIYFKQSFAFIAATYALDGLTGSTFSLLGSLFSYIADITKTEKQRVLGIVIIELIFVLVEVSSSILSGYLIDTRNLGYFKTGLICTFVAFVGFFIFAFLVPESLSSNQRQARAPLLVTLKRPAEFYYSAEFKGMRLCYILLLLCFTFAQLSDTNRSSIEILYFLGQPFCWGPSQIGLFSMARNASKGLVGLLVLRLFQRLMSNQAISIISALSNTASYLVEAFATTTTQIYMVPVAGMFSFLMVPMIRALMSSMAAADKQGALFASMASIQIICSLLSAYIGNGIYAVTFTFMNGFVFLVWAFFCMADFILLIFYCCVKPYKAIEPTASLNVPTGRKSYSDEVFIRPDTAM